MRCKFKSGDIIEGTEGRNEPWARTTRLLIVHLHSKDDVLVVVLKEWHPVTMEVSTRHSDYGDWTLTCRKWEKVGEVTALSGVDSAVEEAKRAWK